jgi:hypothetical protein
MDRLTPDVSVCCVSNVNLSRGSRPSQTARHRLTHVSATPGGSRTTEAARAARDMREDSGMRGCHMPGASHGRGRRASAWPSQSGCPGAAVGC